MIHLLGIRHHGVGSAQNVKKRLEELQPDIVLIEGAPELETVLSWTKNEEMQPPVAALAYNLDNPHQAVFYPFAVFSPEWQAIQYAQNHKIPIRMIDAPLFSLSEIEATREVIPKDPLSYLADLEGFNDSSIWWDYRFERKYEDFSAEAYFEAVLLVMQTLRDAKLPSSLETENIYREAFMRKAIRQAHKEMYHTIAIICGAWHAPALLHFATSEKHDNQLLKSLPKQKVKIGVTWIPWTNARLGMSSGYGAGIASPGWSEYRWENETDKGIVWLSKVAQCFRERQKDISTAHVLEAFRLVDSLCALRGRSHPTLDEMNEAVVAVMCMGNSAMLHIVQQTLIIGEKMGAVPKALPRHPLQTDFEQLAKKNRLVLAPEKKEITLDLRKEGDLNKSIFLHRLAALQISWAKKISVNSRGTFKEAWVLQWKPEMMIEIIERGVWGNTIELAAMHLIQHKADNANTIAELAHLIQQVIPAELFQLMEDLLHKINNLSAVSADIVDLMEAIAPLATVSRYGNVRKTDIETITRLVHGLIERVCIGLPNAVYGLDEETATKMFARLKSVNETIRLLSEASQTTLWYSTLRFILNKSHTAAILSGCICRLLLDAKQIDAEIAAIFMNFALSKGNDSAYAAAWMEGFLSGSSHILLYDDALWNMIHAWIAHLPKQDFIENLPILRRTFAKFSPTERQRLAEKAKHGIIKIDEVQQQFSRLDEALALKGMKKVLQLMGLNDPNPMTP
jgi:hypothetical protein